MADRRLVHTLWLAACALSACSSDTGVSGVLEVSRVEVAPPGGEIVLGGTLQLTATPRTASGIAVPNRTPIWSSSNQAIASVSQSGLVTAHEVGGPVTITARVDGVGGTASITVSAVPVSQVTVAPPQADIQVGESVPLTATPRDASGQPLNRSVAWSSDNPGIAQVNTDGVVLGVQPGNTVIRATADGKTGTAQITVRPRPATRLAFLTQPPNTVAGQPLAPPIQVAVQDAIGNTVTTATTTITVALSTNPTGATLKGTTTRNAVAGIATFSDLLIEKAGTGYVLEATAVALAPGLSNPFAIASGPAQQLAITTQPPATAGSGVPLAPQPVVQLQDAFGNAVAQAGIQVTAAIASGTGGSLSGAVATTDASGAAIFTNLALSGPAGGYTLRFTAPGLTAVVSGTITLAAGTATQLALVTPPSSNAQSGVPLAQQPSVQLRDGSGNPVQQAGITVTASVSPGSGTLGGTTAVVTNASGTATFTNLAISGATGTYTLSFNAPGTGGVTSGPITLGAGPAVRLIIVTQPSSTATSGTPFAQQPVLQVTDLSGNPVSQAGIAVTAALASGAGTLGGTLTVNTDAGGRASYGNLSITGPAGSYTIGFNAPGLNGVVSNTISLGTGTATQLVIVTQPSSTAQSGVPFPQQPVVALRDALNNPVPQAGVSVTATIASGGGLLSGTATVTTDANGVATFTNLAISGTIGNRTLRFDAAGLTGVISNIIDLTAGPAHHLAITTQPSTTAQSGVPLAQQPVVRLRDAAGNGVSQAGVSITASIASGAGGTLSGTLTLQTDAIGRVTYTNLTLTGSSGTYTLAFAATGLIGVTSNPIQLGSGSASKLAITQQPSSTVTNGAVFPQQPIIQLLDAFNNPVAQSGVLVTVQIQTGGGTLSGITTVATDGTGKATFTNLAITGVVGDRTLIFAASGFSSVTSNTVTVVAGSGVALVLTTQPSSSAQSGVPFPQQPVVQVVDQSGNAVSQSGVSVTAVIASGGGTLGGTATVATNASGAAVFTNLSITGTPGNRTLRFDATGLSSVTSNTISLSGGQATQLIITTQPSSSAQSGVPFPQQPVIQIADQSGTPVQQAGVSVTAVIATGGGTLGGTVTVVTNANGTAVYTNLSITGTVGDRTLRFDATGLSSVTSNTISLSAGPPTQLTITTQPSASAVVGVAFSQQPVLQLRDGGGNPVSQAGVNVTAVIASSPGGSPTLGGTVTVATNSSGAAQFTDLSITGTAGAYTLRFDATGLTSATSQTITLTAGAPTKLGISQQPSATVQSGVVFPQQPAIQVQDAGGNPVSQAGVNVTASIASGGGTLGGTATVATNASGVATFTDLSISGAIGNRTLRFDATGLTGVVSNTINVTAGPAAQLIITTQPSSSAQSGVPFPQQPVIQIADQSGNPVHQAGVNVTAVIASGGGTLDGTVTVATNSNGTAVYTNLGITGTVGDRTLQFDDGAGGLTPVTSNTISLGAGPPAQLTITTQPSASALAGVAFSQQPVLQLRDGAGNPVSQAGVNVTAVIASSPGGSPTLGGTTTVSTGGNGVAMFTNLSLTGSAGAYTLRFDATGLTSATSQTITLTAGGPSKLGITTQPSSTVQNGVVFPQQPVIQLQDAGGNPVSQAGFSVTAVIASNPGGSATLGGTTIVNTDVNGVATFTNLMITGTAGAYTLRFDAVGLTSVISNTITVTPGVATQLTITIQPPSSAVTGVALSPSPVVQLRDVSGNAVNVAGVSVDADVQPPTGGASLGGTTTVTTDAAGAATFSNLFFNVTSPPGTYQIRFRSTGLTNAVSSNINVL